MTTTDLVSDTGHTSDDVVATGEAVEEGIVGNGDATATTRESTSDGRAGLLRGDEVSVGNL